MRYVQVARGRRRKVVSCILMIAFVTVTAEAAGKKHYDGETLFRAFFFNAGPVAKLFPELPAWPASATRNVAIENQLIAKFRSADPSFFGRFAADLESGDRVRIRQALQLARNEANKLDPSATVIGNPALKYQFLAQPAANLTALQFDKWTELIATRLGVR